MPRSSGDSLSLNGLAGATGNTQNSNVSLNAINSSAGTIVSMSEWSIESVQNSLDGYTYAVEATNETYEMQFTDEGGKFSSDIKTRGNNFTWTVSPTYDAAGDTAGYLQLESSADYTNQLTVGAMNPQHGGSQTSLLSAQSHTLSATFADGYNDHATRYNTAVTKTVYSVDSYDGNSAALCLLPDSPIRMADGTITEVGDLEEGDILKGYEIVGLGLDDDDYLNWSTSSLSTNQKNVEVVNVVFSFAQRYYNINSDEIKATGEHPMLVKDSSDSLFRFKPVSQLQVGDKLIKGENGLITEVDINSITLVEDTTEIVSIDVEQDDTYMVNGYITHNKGGNSHTDETAPSAPDASAMSWTNGTKTLAWSGDGTNNVFDFDIASDSGFSSIQITRTQYSNTNFVIASALSNGTYYLRVRQYGTNGLISNYSSAFSFTYTA